MKALEELTDYLKREALENDPTLSDDPKKLHSEMLKLYHDAMQSAQDEANPSSSNPPDSPATT